LIRIKYITYRDGLKPQACNNPVLLQLGKGSHVRIMLVEVVTPVTWTFGIQFLRRLLLLHSSLGKGAQYGDMKSWGQVDGGTVAMFFATKNARDINGLRCQAKRLVKWDVGSQCKYDRHCQRQSPRYLIAFHERQPHIHPRVGTHTVETLAKMEAWEMENVRAVFAMQCSSGHQSSHCSLTGR